MIAFVLILTIVLSGLAAGIATYYLNAARDRLHHHSRKAEELFVAVEALDESICAFFEDRYSLLGATQGTEASADLGKARAHLTTAKMLIGFYFPALSGVLARTIAAAATAHRNLKAMEDAPAHQRHHLVAALDASVVELKDALEALKVCVINDTRTSLITDAKRMTRRTARPVKLNRILEVPA